jgi:hypothetical protein
MLTVNQNLAILLFGFLDDNIKAKSNVSVFGEIISCKLIDYPDDFVLIL